MSNVISDEQTKQIALATSILEGYGYKVTPPQPAAERPDLEGSIRDLYKKLHVHPRLTDIRCGDNTIVVHFDNHEDRRPAMPEMAEWQGWPVVMQSGGRIPFF